jgi:hypothetical protein
MDNPRSPVGINIADQTNVSCDPFCVAAARRKIAASRRARANWKMGKKLPRTDGDFSSPMTNPIINQLAAT